MSHIIIAPHCDDELIGCFEILLKEKDINFWKDAGVDVVKLHSSGHATPDDLKNFVEAISPKEIIPIHTLSPKSFTDMFGSKSVVLKNGQSFEI